MKRVMCINPCGWITYYDNIKMPGPVYGEVCTVKDQFTEDDVTGYFIAEYNRWYESVEFIPLQSATDPMEEIEQDELIEA